MTQTDAKVAAKYCINCKWMFPDRNGITEHHECRSPKNPSATNLVDGSQTHKLVYCVTHRNSDGSSKGYCTPAGNWYEETKLQPGGFGGRQLSAEDIAKMSNAAFVSELCKTGTEINYEVGGGGGDGSVGKSAKFSTGSNGGGGRGESLSHLVRGARMIFGRN